MEYQLQWFAKDGNGGEKTEPATAKKLQEARKEGQVAKSQELNHALGLIALFLILKLFISYVGESLFNSFAMFFNKIPEVVDESIGGLGVFTVTRVINNTLLLILKILAPFFLVGFSMSVLINVVQVGWKVTSKPMRPKFSKLNPLNGFKRIFSKDSMFELVKSIAKIALIIYVAYSSIKGHQNELFLVYEIPLLQVILLVGTIVIDTGLRISLIYLFIGIADWFYQKHKFKEDMKMTKQEVKDEYKMTEGNPEIKGRIRKLQRQMALSRMMQKVPDADVIIRNPTHFAVALKYDPDRHGAPMVLAKGQDELALRIVRVGEENGVFIMENRPLARALYDSCEVDREIPPEFYGAVAEILVYIYRESHREDMLQ